MAGVNPMKLPAQPLQTMFVFKNPEPNPKPLR